MKPEDVDPASHTIWFRNQFKLHFHFIRPDVSLSPLSPAQIPDVPPNSHRFPRQSTLRFTIDKYHTMNDNNQQEKWRELHGISEHERIWVSNLGRIKRVSVEVEDPSTFRKLTYIDGRPVYVDSLVLSVFGSDEDAETQSEFNTKDINYKDGDLTNLSADNLEWKKTYKRKLSGRQTKNDSQAERLASMTVTPEMIHNESYPILTAQTQDVSTILPASPDVSPVLPDKSPDATSNCNMDAINWRLD